MKSNRFWGSARVAGRCNERRWAMVKITRVASVGTLAALVLVGGMFTRPSRVQALTTSDKPAAILIWPKVVVDSEASVDTVIQLSNVSRTTRKQAHCFYVNANSHCDANASNAGE